MKGAVMSVPVSRVLLTRATGFIDSGMAAVRAGERPGEPNRIGVLVAASLAGLAIVSLWRFQHQLGPSFVALFAKEGPLENVTYILELIAAALCATAVWRFSRKSSLAAPSTPARWMFGGLALALFSVGMEEINWGQTLLGFGTPEAWKDINHQQETSLHNLLDRNALEGGARAIGVLLALTAVALVAIRMRSPGSLLGQIAPHPALVPLALCVGLASFKQHSEVVELLVAVFFAFYTYRLWALARARTL
jgi:hypothetical protein